MKRFRYIILPFLAFLGLLMAVYGRTLFPPPGYLLYGDDFFRSYNFFRQFIAQSIRTGTIPWWNPYLFSGTPLVANPSVSFWYLPNWIYAVLPYGTAYTALLIFHQVLAASGIYFLCRQALPFRLNRIPAFAAGILFALSGYFMARIWSGHVETVSAQAYMPWVAAMFWRMWAKPNINRTVPAAIALSLHIYAGYLTMTVYTLEVAAIICLWVSVAGRSIKPLAMSVIAILLGLGLAALQLIPNMEFFVRSIRTFPIPYSWTSYGSITPVSFLQMVYPFVFGDQITYRGPSPNYGEQAMYTGLTGILLAGLAVIAAIVSFFKKSNRDAGAKALFIAVGSLVVVAVFSAWASMGPNAPFDLNRILWDILPTYRSIRLPPRHLIQLVFAVSVLAGIGLHLIRNRLLQAFILVLVVMDMGLYARHFPELKPAPGTQHEPELTSILTADKMPYRLLQNFGTWVPPRDVLDFDAAMPYGIYSATGYDPSILRPYYEFADALNGNSGTSVLEHNVQIPYLNVWSTYIDFLNIRYVLVPTGHDPIAGNSERFTLIRENVGQGYRLYRNNQTKPRFFPAGKIIAVPDREAAAAVIRKGQEPADTLIVEGNEIADKLLIPSACTDSGGAIINPVMYGVNEIILNTRSGCGFVLGTSEVMYPGWRAYVDGEETPVVTANLAFRAIKVPSGQHRITMKFVPESVIYGTMITAVTWVVMILILRKRRIY